MKGLVKWMTTLAAVAALAAACDTEDTTPPQPEADAPTIALEGGDIDQLIEIEAQMSVRVKVAAPGGVKDFAIRIESPCLTAAVLEGLGLSTEMNLVNPASEALGGALAGMGFPVGGNVAGKTALAFDISRFVPMIAQIYDKTSDHKFHLTVTDALGQSVTKTLTFHLTGKTAATLNDDADLWLNTVSFSVRVGEQADEVKLEYRRTGEQEWQAAAMTANADGSWKAAIAPAWKQSSVQHASGTPLYELDGKTGFFAGVEYEYRLLLDGTPVEGVEGTFKSAASPREIPNGAMQQWSKYLDYISDEQFAQTTEGMTEAEIQELVDQTSVLYPNPSKEEAFWSNGNNQITPKLCSPDTLAVNTYAAKLKGNAFGTIFAAGNLFTGKFVMEGFGGFARFGQPYAFDQRPRALRLRYKATINNITLLNPTEGFVVPEGVAVGVTDPARIFVCVTDWSDRHSVHSGLSVMHTDVNSFDPEKTLTTDEGEVLAYGSITITESVPEWTELTLPLLWKDKTAKPAAGTDAAPRYSLLISAASSAYGDFLCGNPENTLHLDDIEWVY